MLLLFVRINTKCNINAKKKKSNSKERPMPEVQERIITTESVKSMGERKAIKCDKCNHVMNFKNELTVDKKR